MHSVIYPNHWSICLVFLALYRFVLKMNYTKHMVFYQWLEWSEFLKISPWLIQSTEHRRTHNLPAVLQHYTYQMHSVLETFGITTANDMLNKIGISCFWTCEGLAQINKNTECFI